MDPSLIELSADALFALTRTYHRLSAASDRLHGSHGISTGTRSILLLLHFRGAMTLSEIASDRAVSRQFIQRIAAPLIDGRTVVLTPNPKNRRSPKLVLSAEGAAVVQTILAREAPLLDTIARSVSSRDLANVQRVLAVIDAALDHSAGLMAD